MTDEKEKNDINSIKGEAAQQLAEGRTVTAVSQSTGIARQTLSKWKNHHSDFSHAVTSEREKLWNKSLSRTVGLTSIALDVMRKDF